MNDTFGHASGQTYAALARELAGQLDAAPDGYGQPAATQVRSVRWAGRALDQVLAAIMGEPYLPFGLGDLAADVHFVEIEEGKELVVGTCTSVLAARVPHPGGALAYRIRCQERSVVYATDVVHPEAGPDPKLVSLAQGADLLVHDAQLDPGERASHPDWGHSSWLDAADTARAARVGQLALFHHAPWRSDEQLERIEEEARTLFPRSFLAREGLEVAT